MSLSIINLISKHYNILNTINILDIDHDVDLIKTLVSPEKTFLPEDRYLFVDSDTHYFMPKSDYSLTWLNLIKTFINLNIPLWTIIVISNGNNLRQQFEQLIPSGVTHQMPTVIDLNIALSAFSENLFDKMVSIENSELSIDAIEKCGLTLLGVPRVHRNMLFHQLKNRNLLDNIAVSYKNVS